MAYKDWQKLFDMEKDGAVKEALGKQIPKRPIVVHGNDRENAHCPVCNSWVVNASRFVNSYCQTCGQKIDWSENR